LRKEIISTGAVVLALLFASSSASAIQTPVQQKPAPAVQDEKNKPASEKQGSPKSGEALKKYLEGQRLEQTGNYSGAVAAFKEAIALDPSSADLRTALGSLYLKNRNIIDAESQAREAVKLAPESLDVRKLITRIYLAQVFTGTTLDKEKARAAIKELEEIVRLDQGAKLDVNGQEQPALTLIGSLYLTLEEEDKAIDALKRVSEANASSDEAHFQLASIYYQKNKLREAAAAARKAYDINQSQPRYAGLLAQSLLRLGRTQEAIDIYKKAIGLKDPAGKDLESGKETLIQSPLLFDYAEALVFSGRYDEATNLLDPIIKNIRKDTPLYLNAVRITTDAFRRAGKREEAVRVLEDALKGQDVSESLAILYSLAETYEEMQKFDKAVETYEEALTAVVNPDGTVNKREQDKRSAGIILQRIGYAYRTAGKRDKAMETFERMKKVLGADDPRSDQLVIDTLLNEGKYKEALDVATEAAKRFPDERAFNLARAQAAGRLGDMTTAEATLRTLLKNEPADADIYLFLSSVQLEANQLKQAEESARKAIALEPNDVRHLITLSSVQDRQKKYKESEATLKKALEIDPDNATVLNNLGYFLTERGERLPEAESLIKRAVNIEPTNGSFLDSLGWLIFKQGKVAEAQKYLEQAIIYSPRSPTIHDHLGDIYKKQGQADKAKAQWEEALRLATEPDELKSIREKLGKK
jgi:tetratricopeptide (TPR) repeat protein